jgi:hypothetical protein
MEKLLQLINKFSKYLIAAILVIVPLYPKFPFLKIPGTYVAIRFEDLLLLLLATLVFVKIIPNVKEFIQDEIVQAFLIFFGVGLISLFAGSFLTQTVAFNVGIFHLLRRIEYAIPFFAGLTLLNNKNASSNINFYIKTLMTVIVVAFIYGIGQRYWNFPVIVTQNEEYSNGVALFWTPGSHINSTFAGHYDLAAVMVLLIPIFINMFFILKNWLNKILLLTVSGLGLWLLINSISRISQVAYLLALSVSMILIKKYKELALVFIVSAILIGTSSDIDARFGRIFQVIHQKLSTVGVVLADEITLPAKDANNTAPTPTPVPVFEDRSTSIRFNVEWPRAIRAFTKDPLIGTGYSSIGLAADNDYLRLFAEVGTLGFFAFFLIFFRIAKVLGNVFPLYQKLSGVNQAFMAGAMGGLVGTFLSAVFIDLFEASKFAILFWFLIGQAVYLARNYKNV